jgi:hypothetical protein
LPSHLVAALKQRMLTTRGALIFPARNGGKDGHVARAQGTGRARRDEPR